MKIDYKSFNQNNPTTYISQNVVVEIQNLYFQYRRKRSVLKNINLRIEQGSFHRLIGSNGLGKSTIMKLLIGALINQSGNTLKPKTTNDNNLKLMTNEDWLNHKPFKFNNKTYLNLNDALNDYLKEIGGISNQQFVGKLSSSDIEPNGLVNTNNSNFYKYDINKVSSAYKDANDDFTESYQDALESFINDSNVVTKYYDYKGNFFKDERNAKISMDQISSMPTVFYKINDYNNRVNNINPLNPKDQLALKKIAFDFIQNGGKYSNGLSSPFNFISVLKYNINSDNSDGETKISKEKNISKYSDLIQIYNDFIEKFKINFNYWIMDEIADILYRNPLITVSLTINPYSTEFVGNNDNCIPDFSWNYKPQYFDSENIPTQNYNFNEGYDNESKIIWSKSMNLSEFNKIYNIFTNRKEFEKNFDILNDAPIGIFWLPKQKYEYAVVKNESFVQKMFPSLKNVKFDSISGVNWSYDYRKYECRILSPSDKNVSDVNPDVSGKPKMHHHTWKNNSMITFGVGAYLISENKKTLINKIIESINNDEKISSLINKGFNDLILEAKNDDLKTKINYLKRFLKNKYKSPKYYFSISNDNITNISNEIVATIKKNQNKNYPTINILHPEILNRKFDYGTTKIENNKKITNPKKNKVPCLFKPTLNKIYNNDFDSNKNKIMQSIDMAYREFMTPIDKADNSLNITHVDPTYNDTIFAISDNNLHLKNILGKNNLIFDNIKEAIRILGLFENGENYYKIVEKFTGINLNSINLFDNLKIKPDNGIYKYKLSQNCYNFFITYNGVPLYEINPMMLTTSQAINYNNVSTLDFETLINNWLNNKNDNNLISKIGNDKLDEFIDEFLINVSSNVGFENQTTRINFEYNPDEEKLEIDKRNDSKSYIKIVNKNPARSQDNNNQIDVGELGHKIRIYNDGINSIVKYYNKNLSKIQISNDEFSKLLTKDIFIDNKKKLDNIVVLYKRDIAGKTFEDLIYAEVPWSTNNLNISLTDTNNCSVLATTLEEWKKIAERYKAFTTPAPIHFIYNSKKIISTIFEPNFDNKSPNFVDSIDIIMSNALRNYQIEPDKKMIMYQVKKDRYEPVENQVFNLYQYIINQRKFYFDSLDHANNELIEYIKLNSYLLEETK